MVDDADADALASLRVAALHRRTRPAPIVVVRDLLPASDRAALVSALLEREAEFRSNRDTGRDGSVLADAPETAIVTEAISNRFAEIVAALAEKGAPVGDVTGCALEPATVTAYGHGHFHAPHIDNDPRGGVPAAFTRRISLVWHASTGPDGFTGGDLRLWDHAEIPSDRGPWTVARTFSDHRPIDNALVAFSSYSMHEVLAVTMPDGEFRHRRLAVVTAAHAS